MKKIIFKNKTFIYALQKEKGNLYAIPPAAQPGKFTGCDILWIIDADGNYSDFIKTNGKYKVTKSRVKTTVAFENDYSYKRIKGLPSCDILGNKFAFCVGGSKNFEYAVSQFYWKSLLNECAERTFMRWNKRWREGYVLSTLKLSKYAGTYPAVDHEFHIRGRMAMGNAFDLGIVKRMMLLQIKTMKTDLSSKSRIPCSVQPSGRREYHITRKSIDKTVKALMFPITGIIELCEEMYNYYCLTKDIDFIKENISSLEKGLEYAISFIDDSGRLFSDVYYEDQVMKNGRTAQAQAFAINSFCLMSKLESILQREEKSVFYKEIADKMKANYISPVPNGCWDNKAGRYVDWTDREGKVHDHIHLLSNALSVTYGFNNNERNKQVNKVIAENDNIFQKFPSFVSARIEDYTKSEIGVGGPYDLCAAGRYWCHDAKYRRSLNDAEAIKKQLEKVYRQALSDNFQMGERYDMNYVYYNTGSDTDKSWHGSPLYYEYPNVFIDVLIHDFFGILYDEDCDLFVAPCCTENTEIYMESFNIAYSLADGVFTLTNISSIKINVKIDLSKIFDNFTPVTIDLKPQNSYIYRET